MVTTNVVSGHHAARLRLAPETRKAPFPGSFQVEENGARLNRSRLVSAYLLAGSLAARPWPETQVRGQIGPRVGAVQEAVIHVLAAANKPLRAREIHSAAQELAGTALSWNTVKGAR